MVKKAFVVVALIIIVFSLAGCHTIQGLGEDIKWIGVKGEEIIER
jgi:predicted small secreted protein